MLHIACLCPTQPKSPRSRVQREIYQWQEPIISMIAAFLITRWRGWQRVGRPKSPKCSDLCGFFTTDQTNGTNGPPNMGGRSRISLDSVFPTSVQSVQSVRSVQYFFFQNEDYFSLMLFNKCSLHRHIPVFDWFLYHWSWLPHLTKFHL